MSELKCNVPCVPGQADSEAPHAGKVQASIRMRDSRSDCQPRYTLKASQPVIGGPYQKVHDILVLHTNDQAPPRDPLRDPLLIGLTTYSYESTIAAQSTHTISLIPMSLDPTSNLCRYHLAIHWELGFSQAERTEVDIDVFVPVRRTVVYLVHESCLISCSHAMKHRSQSAEEMVGTMPCVREDDCSELSGRNDPPLPATRKSLYIPGIPALPLSRSICTPRPELPACTCPLAVRFSLVAM